MKRRSKALIAIVLPILIVLVLKYTHDASYKWLMGYMAALALVFKTSIISLWLAAKLHVISFMAGLTLFQGIFLLIKRWLLDSVLATWIQTYIIENVIDAVKEAKDFYFRQDLKTKFKNIFLFLFGLISSGWILYLLGLLDNIVLFAELRLFIAGVFAAIVTFVTKVTAWTLSILALSWIGPLLQVFAFSYILTQLEEWFGPNNIVSRFFNAIANSINFILYQIGIVKRRHIDTLILDPVILKSKQMGTQLSNTIRDKKIREEYRHSENFENIIMKGHIDAYRSFKGLNKVTDKTDLYTRINQKTGNNMDIVAYVSRSVSGELVEEAATHSEYHDVFLLESYASHQVHGVKIYEDAFDDKHINQKDFWVLNTNAYPIVIGSNSDNFQSVEIPGNALKLIKVQNPFCYKFGDVFCAYQDKKVTVTAIDRS